MLHRPRRTLRPFGLYVETLHPDTAEAVALGEKIKGIAGGRPARLGIIAVAVRHRDPILASMLEFFSIGRDVKLCARRAQARVESDPLVVRGKHGLVEA